MTGLFRNREVVPALMFHSVGLQDHSWAWSQISESLQTFEAKIADLSEAGFTSIFWSDLYQYMSGRKSLPRDSILLTFDDGYLDNWVYVFPILKKYGMKATIFMTTDFVDPGESLRPNLDSVAAGECSDSELSVPGFLSWPEMREMEASGFVDIQSHAMTHTWYFSGPRVVDIHRPEEVPRYPWLYWNARTDRKPCYLGEDQQHFLPWGYPVLEHEKSLAARRFLPDDTAVNELVQHVAENGGDRFCDSPAWEKELQDWMTHRFGEPQLPGVYESDEERRLRVLHELSGSKKVIEENLGKKVDFICWPGGANSEFVKELARESGYKSWTLDSKSEASKRNLPGEDPESIRRIGTSNALYLRGKPIGQSTARYQLWKIYDHQGSVLFGMVIRLYKAALFLFRRNSS